MPSVLQTHPEVGAVVFYEQRGVAHSDQHCHGEVGRGNVVPVSGMYSKKKR